MEDRPNFEPVFSDMKWDRSESIPMKCNYENCPSYKYEEDQLMFIIDPNRFHITCYVKKIVREELQKIKEETT